METSGPVSFYLNCLPVLFEDVYSHHSFVEVWIQRLDDFIVKMLLQMQKRGYEMVCANSVNVRSPKHRADSQAAYLILQSIKAFEDEFKHGVEVVRAR